MKFVDSSSCQFWLHDFKSLEQEVVLSNSWVADGTTWQVKVYPKGNKLGENHSNLSIYVAAVNLTDSDKVNVKLKFALPAPSLNCFSRRDSTHKFCVAEVDWGFTRFCALADVDKNHLFNGCLLVRVGLRPKPVTAASKSHQENDATADGCCKSRCIVLRHKDEATASNYFDSDVFSDVTITACTGEQFKCHKVVLASASKPLAGMLSNGMVESRTAEIKIPNYSTSTVKAFLQFIYGVPVELSETGQLYELCCMADQYMVTVLIEACTNALKEQLRDPRQLNVDLACSILTTHSISSLKQAHDAAVLYILVRLEAAVQDPAFVELPVEAMQLLMSADPLRAVSEKLMLEAVLKWVEADFDSRWQHLEELVAEVRFYGMCFEEIYESKELIDVFANKHCSPHLTSRGKLLADACSIIKQTIDSAVHQLIKEATVLKNDTPVEEVTVEDVIVRNEPAELPIETGRNRYRPAKQLHRFWLRALHWAVCCAKPPAVLSGR